MAIQRKANSRSAFTLIEVLVVFGILMVLIGLAMPLLTASRSRAAAARSLSNIRQLVMGLGLYANENKDLPPVYRDPKKTGPWIFEFGSIDMHSWFDHAELYSFALTAFLEDSSVATAPGNPARPLKRYPHAGSLGSFSDYALTNTLYADAGFFRWETRDGPAQFRAQRLSDIAHPSAKGLIYATWMHHFPQYGPVPACCVVDLPSPIAFADMSASEHVMRRMPVGVFNPYTTTVVATVDPKTLNGIAVADTTDGIRGRDR